MLEDELKAAIAAARHAGTEVARMREEGIRYGHKEDFELVSEADLHAAEILRDALANAFPDTGWLSEEDTDTAERLDCERVWVVDPIDGTREYLRGLPEYAISVGLVIRGEPALGVVYNPATDEMHAAICDTPRASPRRAAGGRYLALVGHGEDRLNEVPPLPGLSRTKPVGSVAYRLALVAAGKGDLVVTWYPRNEWDVAAGAALCQARGITITDVLGAPLQFNQPSPLVRGLIAAPADLHERVRSYFSEVAN